MLGHLQTQWWQCSGPYKHETRTSRVKVRPKAVATSQHMKWLHETFQYTGNVFLYISYIRSFSNLFRLALKLQALVDCYSHNLVGGRLSVRHETCPPISQHHPFVIGSSKYRVESPQLQYIVGSLDRWEFPPFYRGIWQSPCAAPTAGKSPAAGAVQGGCGRVWQSPESGMSRPVIVVLLDTSFKFKSFIALWHLIASWPSYRQAP